MSSNQRAKSRATPAIPRGKSKTTKIKTTPIISFHASLKISVSLTDASIEFIRTAQITAPISELLPPTAAQTTIEIENEMSKKVGEANSAATT